MVKCCEVVYISRTIIQRLNGLMRKTMLKLDYNSRLQNGLMTTNATSIFTDTDSVKYRSNHQDSYVVLHADKARTDIVCIGETSLNCLIANSIGGLVWFWLSCTDPLVLLHPNTFNLFGFLILLYWATWWKLFQKRVGRTKFDIYDFVKIMDNAFSILCLNITVTKEKSQF